MNNKTITSKKLFKTLGDTDFFRVIDDKFTVVGYKDKMEIYKKIDEKAAIDIFYKLVKVETDKEIINEIKMAGISGAL